MTNEEIAAQLSNAPLPTIATGLLYHGLLLEKAKTNSAEPLEFDSLKLTDKERRKRFGQRIKIMRDLRGLTQTQLAAQLGITPQAVAAFERGKAEPSLKSLIGLSRALEVTTDWLLDAEPPLQKNKTAE